MVLIEKTYIINIVLNKGVINMKLVRQLFIILLILFIGELIHNLFVLSIPGNVIGMLILVLCLCTKIIKLEWIEEVSNFLLNHLALFFLPAGVSLISCLKILNGKWIPLLCICLISTVIVITVTGFSVQILINLQKKNTNI